MQSSEYHTTFHGLHGWTKAVFEKLGWMVLAKQYGHEYKIEDYKKGIMHLQNALKEKMGKTKDADRLEDLKALMDNVDVLRAHVEKDFGPFPQEPAVAPSSVGGRRRRK